MFTPKKIAKAFENLFELFDEDILSALNENYHEEIDDISPFWLAKAFNANATKLCGYRAVSHIGDGVNFYGKPLTKKKGVLLLNYLDSSIENDHLQMVHTSELWLLEDMSFAHVRCIGTLIKGDERPDAATEYRQFVRRVARKDDIFFEPDDLICNLDDSCTFAQVMNKATICEPNG